MDDRGNVAAPPIPRAGSARTAWLWATFAVLLPSLLLWVGISRMLLVGVAATVVAAVASMAARRGELAPAATPVPDPVPAPVRAVDTVWLALLAHVLPVIGIGPGSSCETCARVDLGLGITWVGCALLFLAYLATFRRDADARRARWVAGTFVPATFVVIAAGMWIASS